MPVHRQPPPALPSRPARAFSPALRAAILLLGLGGAFGLAPAHAAGALALQLSPVQMQALGVETQLVPAAGSAAQEGLPARVAVPNDQVRMVTAPLAGLVEALLVAPGQTVKKGQVVARLSSPEALALQRDGAQAASQALLAEQVRARDAQLFSEGLIAESRLQATRAAAAQADAQASERRLGLALAGAIPGKLGGKLALTASIDGVVLEQGVQLGQRVETSAMIYRIAKLSPLWLEIQAPADTAAPLREGMPVKLAGSEVVGRLIAIGRAVDAASQTVLLRAEVGKGAETLRPGQVVEVEIASPAGPQQSLPAGALARHQGQTLAFVQVGSDDKGSRFEARPVRIVSQGGDRVRVDGIKAGEKVVVKGVSGLKAMLAGVGKE